MTSLMHPAASRIWRDRAATAGVYLAFGLALVPLAWILWSVATQGIATILHGNWWTNSQRNVTSDVAGGGAYHAVIGTLEQAAICSLIAVPIAILTAVYLVEYGRGRLARAVSFMVDILTGVPSIVAALFIYAVWVSTLGGSRIGLAVSLALVLLMIPVVVRATEEMLKLVPNELREASYALGVPKWQTIARIVLPTALGGIVTGVMLGLARVMGETAPLLILGPYAQAINLNPFDGNQAALPTLIKDQFDAPPDPPAVARMWAAAFTLIIIVLALNLAGRLVARTSGARR
jgi:phosphate transport system permease protein